MKKIIGHVVESAVFIAVVVVVVAAIKKNQKIPIVEDGKITLSVKELMNQTNLSDY